MSVCLPVKTCLWDRQLTYLVRKVISSLIISLWYLLYIVASGCVSIGGINPYIFPKFRICCNTGRIPSRGCVFWSNRLFNFRSNNAINNSQICVLNSVINRINDIVPFPVNPFIKTSFQGFYIQCIFNSSWIFIRSNYIKFRSLVP